MAMGGPSLGLYPSSPIDFGWDIAFTEISAENFSMSSLYISHSTYIIHELRCDGRLFPAYESSKTERHPMLLSNDPPLLKCSESDEYLQKYKATKFESSQQKLIFITSSRTRSLFWFFVLLVILLGMRLVKIVLVRELMPRRL
jgi:hypothetical protein